MGSEADILDYPDLHYSFFPLLALAQPTPRILRKTPNRQVSINTTGQLQVQREPLQSPSNATPFPPITSLPHPHHSSPCSSHNTLFYQSPSPELCSDSTTLLYNVLHPILSLVLAVQLG